MFCQCNEALRHVDISTDQSCTQLDITQPHKSTPVSGPQSASDVVVLSDDETTAGSLSEENQIQHVASLLDAKSLDTCLGTAGLDCGILPKIQPSCFEIQGNGTSLSGRTQVGKMDVIRNNPDAGSQCFNDHGIQFEFEPVQERSVYPEDNGRNGAFSLEQNPVSDVDLSSEQSSSDTSTKVWDFKISNQGMFSSSPLPCTGSGYPETRGKGGLLSRITGDHEMESFFEQNRTDVSTKEYSSERGMPFSLELSPVRSRYFQDDSKQGQESLSNETKFRQWSVVREQISPEADLQEHFTDHHLGLGIAFEPSPDWLRYPGHKDSEKPVLNFGKDERLPQPMPVPEKLWPDNEPPVQKRFKTFLPAVTKPSAEKSSCSAFSGLPVETSICAVDYVLPRSSVFSTRAVSFTQSEEGVHVITEETVAHTVFDDLPPSIQTSRNTAPNRNSKDQRHGSNSADFSANRSTTSVPERSDSKRTDDLFHILSPSSESTTIVCRAPSKTSASYLIGSTDRADIAGGWKPVCGQTVVRKPLRKPSQTSVQTTSEGTRKPSQPLQVSLWNTFGGATQKSGTHALSVSGGDRFEIAKKDQEPVLALPDSLSTSRPGGGEKSGNLMNNFLDLPSISTATPLNRCELPSVKGTLPGMARTSSFGEGLESAGVWNSAKRSNDESISKSANSFQNSASNSNYGRDGRQDVVSKWHKFQETAPTPRSRQPPVLTTSSSLVRTVNQTPFQHCQPQTQTTTSDLVRTTTATIGLVKTSGNNPTLCQGPLTHQTATSNLVKPHTATSSLVRTRNQTPFQHRQPQIQSTTSDLVRTLTTTSGLVQTSGNNPTHPPTQTATLNLAKTHTATSSLVRSTGHGGFQSEVQQSMPSRRPEVACVTPQVRRQPLRALHLDHDSSHGVYCIV